MLEYHEPGVECDGCLSTTVHRDDCPYIIARKDRMHTLTIVEQPAPAGSPDLDMTGVVATTALVTPKRGDAFYICNPMDEVIEALEAKEPFVAHTIVGMKAKRVIIEPGTIARIEER